MANNDTYSVSQGGGTSIDVTLADADGNPITTFTGTEPLTTTVWPGGTRAASFSPVTSWNAPALGTIRIAIAPAQTTGLTPGQYQLLTQVTIAGVPYDAYACSLVVTASAGTTAAPPSYCDYSWLLKFSRGWLRQLQTDDDEVNFAEQLGRARSWLEDMAHAHYRVASMQLVVGGMGMGPRRSGARSTWLQQQLDANTLLVTDQIRECCAMKALAYICGGQIGSGGSNDYGKLARYYHSQADYLAGCLTLALDTDGDGYADVVIDCTCTDPMNA